MRGRALAAGLLLAACAPSAVAVAQSVVFRDAGRGEAAGILQSALSTAHRLIGPAAARREGEEDLVVPRGSVENATVVVLGRSAAVAGTVHGDVIVVGGDLYLHPGAQVDGRAVAIGGGAYKSLLAIARGGYLGFRDLTYDVAPTVNGYALTYRRVGPPPSPPITLGGLYGFGLPTYDRSDGFSPPFAAAVSLDSARLQAAPTLTYRSQLGRIDPALSGDFQPNRLAHLEAFVGRSTFTNDAWIWSDAINSAAVLFLGNDTRNYFRADRAEVVGHYLIEGRTVQLEPLAGVRVERAWSVRPGSGARAGGSPWSLFGHGSTNDILRPNPAIDDGKMTSALVGTRLAWQGQGGVAVNAVVEAEIAGSAPASRHFTQATTHGSVGFPTFGNQRFDLETHWVLTAGDTAPRQRWAYIGGAGTLPFLGLLQEGGDQLLYVQSAYSIPIPGINFPVAGQPTLQLRDVLGSAGVRRLPSLEQNVGVRLILSLLRFDAMADPSRGRVRASLGLSMAR